MSNQDMALMAHLLRRAGFSATRDELEEYVTKGYEATVEELLYPSDPQNMPDDVIRRYHVDLNELRVISSAAGNWMYRMITSRCPLEEKIALFWHGLFACGFPKVQQMMALSNQIQMFREYGLGSFRDLLVEISKDPAMGRELDNIENHKGAINENYGRELLELFSMGIGSYNEDDIKEASRAFTGWTRENVDYTPFWPYGRIAWHYQYRDDDHDDGEKSFLGDAGKFDGDEVIDIIVRQEVTARFICRRLFQFFAADEVDDEGEKVIQTMMKTYFDSGYEIRSILRTLFNCDYFKSKRARFARVKAPVEVVVGTARLTGSFQRPDVSILQFVNQSSFMGQTIFFPPAVEGWHEGAEWIDSGALVERLNFVAKELSDIGKPGIRLIIDRLASENGGVLSPEELVDRCLDLVGPISVSDDTRATLVEYAAKQGDVVLKGHQPGDDAEQRVGDILRLVASTREFQLA